MLLQALDINFLKTNELNTHSMSILIAVDVTAQGLHLHLGDGLEPKLTSDIKVAFMYVSLCVCQCVCVCICVCLRVCICVGVYGCV